MFINQSPATHKKSQTWGASLNPINVSMTTSEITKTGTLATTLHKPAGKENPYVLFGYDPLKNFNHTRGKFSGSMNADSINMMHTSQ